MNKKPIIFNTEMVKAILDGRKTQTRRVIKPQPEKFGDIFKNAEDCYIKKGALLEWNNEAELKCPYGKPENHLWVRETFQYYDIIRDEDDLKDVYEGDGTHIIYKANDEIAEKWRPSIYMPRWASHIDLEITNIRVEQLQDISNDDAIAEGFLEDHMTYEWEPRFLFIYKWNKINEKRGYSFESNPWVWVIEFKLIKNND